MMATINEDGSPYASTAPFVMVDNCFYIFISTVAQHGRNIVHHPHVSLLFAEDESTSQQPFARKRLTIEATTQHIERETPTFVSVMERFQTHFDPAIVTTLISMGDFHLWALAPRHGSFVIGFGQAYRVDESLTIQTPIMGHHHQGKA